MIPTDTTTVMLVDDDDDLRAAIRQTLDLAGFRVLPFAAAAPALAALEEDFAGVVVSDVRMPQMSGIALFEAIRARDAELPVILVTGHGDVAMAVEALHAGAWDFLAKPFDPDALVAAVGRAAAQRSLALDNRRLRRLLEEPVASALVGRSPAIVRLRATIAMLADAEIDVIVEGETGTGKDLIARLIHRAGRRARHPFVTIACAALPDGLIEAELSGAGSGGIGQVRRADRGTLLLDDLDRASPALQARLAELAESRTVRVAGTRDPVPVDLRIVSTGSDPARIDAIDPALFFRLAGVRMRVPPLRERAGDVPMLFAHLLDAAAGRLRRPVPALSEAVRRRLATHDWPGNVRELASFADRVMLGLEGEEGGPAPARSLADAVAAFERQEICAALQASVGDASLAMRMLGLPRKTFYYKVQRHGIRLDLFRPAKSAGRGAARPG